MYNHYNNFPEAVVVINNNKIIYTNTQATTLFCFNPNEILVGKDFLEFIHSGFIKKVNKFFSEIIKEPSKVQNEDIQISICNDKTRWVNIKGATGVNKNDIFIIIRDITDEILTKEKFKENEERFNILLENQIDAVAVFDESGTILFANPAALAMIKATKPTDIIGRKITRFIAKSKIKDTLKRIKLLYEGKKGLFPDYNSYVDLYGNLIPVHVYASIVKYNGAKAVQIIIRDISVIQKHEGQLYLEKIRYKNLLNSLPVGLIIHYDNKIVFINKKGVEFTGLESYLKALNHKISEFFEPISKGTTKYKINNFLQQKDETILSQKLLFKRIDGNKFPVEVIVSPIVYENKDAVRLIIRDITEKERALERLQETETRLQLLIETSPDIICFKDGKGRWLLANKADLELFDLQEIDYFGKTDAELAEFTPFHRDAFLNCMVTDEKTWDNGILSHNDEIIETKHAGTKIYDVYKIPLYNPDKTRKGLVVIGRDVTEDRKIEKKVTAQKEKAQKYLNIVQVIMLSLDTAGNITLINNMGVKILGYNNYKELLGKNWYDITCQIKEKRIQKKARYKAIMEGKIELKNYKEDFIKTKSGDKKIIGWHNTLLYDEQGNISGILSSGIDVTETRNAQKELQQQQDQLKLIINKAPVLLAYADSNVNYLYVNKAYADFYHSTPEYMRGKPAKDFLTVDYYKSIEPYIDDVLQGNEIIYENKRVNNEGETIYIKATYIPHFGDNGNVDAFLAMIEDITESKTKENKLKEALEKAEINDRLKQAFLSNLSHEFRTPMNAVIGFAQLLEDEMSQSPLAIEYLNIIISSTYHLLDLLSSVIELSQIEAGDIKIKHQPVNINNIINGLFTEYQNEANMKDIQLHCETPLENDKAILMSDSKRLKQVIKNLLINALKFTQKGSISFGYKIMKNNIKFFVKDTGIGIPYDQQKSIFEHFRQVEVTHTRHYGGAGVGLTTCKFIVEKMGGEIHLFSIPEKGSTFSFTIPYNPQEIKQSTIEIYNKQKEIIPKSDFTLFNNKMVLLVEDDKDVVFYYQTLFRKSNIKLIVANSGKECINIVNEEHNSIDIILMDIRMEDIDGITLTQKVKSKYKEIPIIIQTAFSQENEIKDSHKAGADDYITKPINRDKLFAKMKKLIIIN